MQSKTMSLIEQILNVMSGILISLFTWLFIIKPLYDIDTSMLENISITLIFATVSVARGYLWRRIFNRIGK